MVEIYRLKPDDISSHIHPLVALLQQVVEEGASLGFLPPLATDDARQYWDDVWEDVAVGAKVLLAARTTPEDDIETTIAPAAGEIIGTAQLALERRPNARHRAEVQKMMVRADMRRHGVAGHLMRHLETEARAEGRTLLILDTRRGDSSENLYQKWGYTQSGIIPQYARSADGKLHDTVFYYKLLTE